MDETPFKYALAGLLHDIGKFAQRAGDQVRGEWFEKRNQTEFKYQHALLTWHFMQKFVPEDFGVDLLAAYHHRPQNAAQKRIRLADQLSSGERDSGLQRDDTDRTTHPRQLISIFSRIQADGLAYPNETKAYLPVNALQLEEKSIFPGGPWDEKQLWPAYEGLWNAFCEEVRGHSGSQLAVYLEAMQALMQRYTSQMPSAYFKTVPDVSLYDHSRMTAALAVCLADVEDAEVDRLYTLWQKGGDESPVALLIGGDISGVQDFVYSISSKKAAQALRGRSFYLQLLTEAVLRFVLRELDLPYTNVIYSGGGHFYMLAPLSSEKRLDAIRAAVSRKLLAHHSSSLYMAIGHTGVPLSGFALGRFPAHWEAMHRQMQYAKSRRFEELGEDLYDLVFAVSQDGGGDKHCAVCGVDDVPLELWARDENENEAISICRLCRSFVERLGKPLPQSRFVLWKAVDSVDAPRESFQEALRSFGADVHLLKDGEKATLDEGDMLWALDDPESWPDWSRPAPRWLRYSVQQIPWKGALPITFDELQKETLSDFHRLGVLRMDVDNLGDLFKEGLGEKASLSRLSALSSAISLYFEGRVKRIIEEGDLAQKVYSVYAGGDDLFLIGPWDVMPDLAVKILEGFRKFTGHPGLHISGGMAFIDGKYPMYQAAEDAGAAEQMAKSLPGKNAFVFLGRAWKWEEFEKLSKQKATLLELVGQGASGETRAEATKSLLMLLRNLAKMESRPVEGRERPVWGRWMWMGSYHLRRAQERLEEKNDELAMELESFRASLEKDNYRQLHLLGAAARWAQLLTRGKQRQKEAGQ